MFEIKSKEDIELLKQISECFIQQPSEDLDKIFAKMQDVESSFAKQNKIIGKQNKIIKELQNEIKQMDVTVKKISKENEELFEKIKNDNVSLEKTTETKSRYSRYLTKDDLFIPYVGAQILYENIALDGIRLIHTSKTNQQFPIPINVFELIVILEEYKADNPGIFVEDVNKLCEEFNITKMQFSKIYHNLLEGTFDDIIHQVDKMITTSLFVVEKGFIYRNDKNTNISVKEFKEMYEEYAESDRPFFTIYSIIKESADYDAYDIFITLRKKDVLLRMLRERN